MTQKTFDTLDVGDAFTHVADNLPNWFAENQDFYEGEHWQKGTGFKDVKLPPNHWAQSTVSTGIMSIFISQNLIAECIDRRTDALLSKMPRIDVRIPDDDDAATRAENKKNALRNWFRDKRVRSYLKDFASDISLHQESFLRLRVPAGRLQSGRIPGNTPEEVLQHIFVENHQRDTAVVLDDDYSGESVGMVIFDAPDSTQPVFKTGGPTARSAEFSYVRDSDRATVLKVLRDDSDDAEEITMDLGGRLTIFRGEHDAYVTQQVKDAQRGINTTLTLMLFSNRESNFQQRVYFNAMPPGKEVEDPATGEKKFVVDALERGPDKDIFLAGLVEEQEDGTRRIMQPDMRVIEPGTAERFIKTIRELRLGLYRHCRQLHIELTDDATSTGEARMQAAADHEQDVNEFKLTIEEAGHWLLETAWAMAEYFATGSISDDAMHSEHVVFECIVDLGPIAASRRQAVVQEVQVGLKSKQSGRIEIGVLDVEHERELVRREQDEDVDKKKLKAEIVSELIAAGFDDPKSLLEFVDIEVDLGDLEEPEPPPQPVPTGPLTANPAPPEQ